MSVCVKCETSTDNTYSHRGKILCSKCYENEIRQENTDNYDDNVSVRVRRRLNKERASHRFISNSERKAYD